MDRALLHITLDRETYYRFVDLIKVSQLSGDTAWFLDKYGKFYDQYPEKKSIDAETFLTFIQHVLNLKLKDDKVLQYRDSIEAIEHYKDAEITEDILRKYLKLECAQEVADLCNRIEDGADIDFEEVKDLLNDFEVNSEGVDNDDFFVTNDIHELVEATIAKPGLHWRLDCLNRGCGDIRGGDMAIVFARPDSGKTSFVISETTHMAAQLPVDQDIIWFNNEEDGHKLGLRMRTCILDASGKEVLDKPDESEQGYRAVVGRSDRIKVVDSAAISTNQVKQILDKHKAGVVVFNTLDKVLGFHKLDQGHMRLTRLYQWAREIAKEYNCIVFAICQANVECDGATKLTMAHIADSKTGKPGEADLIIGIGRDPNDEDYRYINTPKNKLIGGTHPDQRVVYAPVLFNKVSGRFDNESSRY